MGMLGFISGAWRTPKRAEAFVNGAWRRLLRGEAYIGGQWRTIVSFVGPLSVSANNASRGGNFGSDATRTLSASSTATPAGGRGPYTYAWTLTSGNFTLNNANMATASFSATLFGGDERTGTAQVVCTDAGGLTAVANITITIRNYSTVGGTA